MSYTYSLVCFESKEVLSVGKIVSIDEEGTQVRSAFGSWIDQDTGTRIPRSELLELVEVFVIHNRCYEIRLLPDDWIHKCDPTGQLSYFDSAAEYLAERQWLEESEDVEPVGVPDDICAAFLRVIGE